MALFLDPYNSGDLVVTLNDAMQVSVQIAPGSLFLDDGTTNSSSIRIEFITIASPIYATVDYIILEGGEILELVPEAAIYSLSYAASVLVDDMILWDSSTQFASSDPQTIRRMKFFNRARTEFVKCKVCADMLRAIISSRGMGAGRKLLADFSIDTSALAGLLTQARPLVNDYVACYQYWQKVINAAGAVDFESPMGKAGVRAGNIIDGFGGIGRSWIPDSDNLKYREPEVQQGNTRSRPRRFGERNPLADWDEI